MHRKGIAESGIITTFAVLVNESCELNQEGIGATLFPPSFCSFRSIFAQFYSYLLAVLLELKCVKY